MIKEFAFLLTLLLASGLAYAENPSASLSGNVAANPPRPDGANCPTTPPPPARLAGFTTLAFCENFSLPKYANLRNWLDASGQSEGQFEQFCVAGANGSCDSNHIFQDVDPTTGKTVMHVKWNRSDCLKNNCRLQWASTNSHNGYDFPISFYTEVRMRETPSLRGYVWPPHDTPFAYFMWISSIPAHQAPFMEQDVIETYALIYPGFGGGDVHWGLGCRGVGPLVDFVAAGADGMHQNTYGWLTTVDSTNTIKESTWLNGVLTSSPGHVNPQVLSPTGCFFSAGKPRLEIGVWFGGYGTAGNDSWPGGIIDYYIEYIAVWACANWQTDNICSTTLKP